MWNHRAKFCQKSAGKSSEKSNQAMDLQQTEDEEPSYALVILDGTAKPENSMICIVDGEKYPLFTEHTWIGDTGSLCHITNQSTSMYDVKSNNYSV